MANKNSVKRKISQKIEKVSGFQNVVPGRIGASSTLIDTGIPGLIYVRIEGSGQVVAAVNSIVPSEYNHPVLLARSKMNKKIWEVIASRQAYSFPVNGDLRYHHAQHEHPNPDTTYIKADQFLPFLATPSEDGGFVVQINGGVVTLDGVRYLVNNQTLDLTSFAPTTGAVWVLIEVDSVGAIDTVVSAEYDSKELLTPDNIPLSDAGAWDLCAVRLYVGQEQLRRDTINDFVDLRFGQSGVGGGNVTLLRLGATVQHSLQYMQNVVHSTGWIDGGEITDNGDGTIAVAGGVGTLRATDDSLDTLYFANWATDSSVSLTDDAVNWIYVAYNAGTPLVTASTTEPTDYNTNIILAKVYRNGTELHINATIRHTIGDHAGLMMRSMQDTMPFAWVSGAVISEVGTRQFSITEGEWWNGLTHFTTAAFDGTTDTFNMYYRDGVGGWTEVTGETAINNTQYDDGTGTLATLTAARYGVHWVFVGTDNDIHCVLGQGNYTLAQAQAATAPSSIPPELETDSRLAAKIIIQKSASVFISLESFIGNMGAGVSGAHTHALVDEDVQDIVGAMFSGNTETGMTVDYDDATGKLNVVAEVPQTELDDALDAVYGALTVHDHAGGDGAQIDHGGTAGLTDDDHTQYVRHNLSTAGDDFLVGSGSNTWLKKTLAEAVTILRTVLDTVFAPITKGVTNGDTHDHLGGDGNQVAYSSLSGTQTQDSNTYTPTLTNVQNITSSSVPNPFMWIRLGNLVVGSGRIVVAHDGSGDGHVRFTLPIASNLADNDEVQGNATNPAAARASSVIGDATNNEAILVIDQAVGTGTMGWRIIFMYEIIP